MGRPTRAVGIGGLGKIKIATVMDQGSDGEIELLPGNDISRYRRNYEVLMGDAPGVDFEVTDSQLSALVATTATGAPPYCDFGVWGRHGARLERRLKFRAHFMGSTGTWTTQEVPGADCLDTWAECFGIFKTAAIMSSTASPATLDKYEAEFRRRCARYPGTWHICAQADIRCRSEWWVAERRRQEAAHAANPALSAYDPQCPWNSVIRASSVANDFWDVELKEPALLYTLGSGRPTPVNRVVADLVDVDSLLEGPPPGKRARLGKGRGEFAPPGGKDGGKGGKNNDDKRSDGRFYRGRTGVSFCFKWAQNVSGCQAHCPDKRLHCCEFCRTPHRTISCTKNPGWTPPGPPLDPQV
jgi:hypothetical protein